MARSRTTPWRAVALVAGLVLGGLAAPAPAGADEGHGCGHRTNHTYRKLLECVSGEGAMEHMAAFQAIADENGGSRALGTPGYAATVDYVADQARSWGYDVTVEEFIAPTFDPVSGPELENVTAGESYEAGEEVIAFTYSGSGDVTATAEGVALELPPPDEPNTTESGCDPAHFDDFTPGNIAVIQRGVCPFAEKAVNAEEAGAAAVVIFNEGQEGRTDTFAGTLSDPVVDIPAVATSFDIGTSLVGDEVHLAFEAEIELEETWNVHARTPGGRDDNVVVAGAHLDSVLEGPGINDNGSGSATLLEVAGAFRKVRPENAVQFSWWGAEEFGLRGSNHYVGELSDQAIDDLALYLNFDMVGSPNYVRFVFDGDGDAFDLPGPDGSASIEALYEDFYALQGLANEPTPFSGRSDYAAFFNRDVPVGGLFTGAEGTKTEEEAAIYGGTVGEQYDPCYHTVCDTLDNVSLEVLDVNVDAVAFSILTYSASTEDVNGEVGRPVPGGLPDGFGEAEAPADASGGASAGGAATGGAATGGHEHHATL